MTAKKAYMDVIYQVGEEGEDPLTIRPEPDFPSECVQIIALDASAIEYWGSVRISLPKALALKMGEALIAAAKDTP